MRAFASAIARLLDAIFGGINPPSNDYQPDIDGRRDSGDASRAALEIEMHDQMGPGSGR